MFESLGCGLCRHALTHCVSQDGFWWKDLPHCNLTGKTLTEENYEKGVVPIWCPYLPIEGEECNCEDCKRARGEI